MNMQYLDSPIGTLRLLSNGSQLIRIEFENHYSDSSGDISGDVSGNDTGTDTGKHTADDTCKRQLKLRSAAC